MAHIRPNEETILKDTKNTIEDTIEKIKENVRENKISCILMIGFLLLFCVVSGPEIAREAASQRVQTQPEGAVEQAVEQQSETMQTEMESETAQTEETVKETERETEAEPAMTPQRMRELRARYGKRFHIPMLTPYEDTDATVYLELPERFRLRGYALPEIKPEKTMAGLEQVLTEQLSEYEGTWSVYVKNLSTDESFVLNDQPMKSASVMKLFIMGTVYKAFESGELEIGRASCRERV